MKIEEACAILKRHNEWRRGAEIEQENPTQIGHGSPFSLSKKETPILFSVSHSEFIRSF